MSYRFLYILILLPFLQSCSDQPAPPLLPSENPHGTEETNIEQEVKNGSSFLEQEVNLTDYQEMFTNLPPENDTLIQFGQNQIKRPPSWIWIRPKSSFVLSNYILPGILGEESGVFTISRFEIGEGGDFETNILRWKGHFRNNEGAPIKPVVTQIEINGRIAQMVHFNGEYMGAGAAWHKPDYTLLIVLYEDETSRYFFKLLGPTETISAHRDALYDAIQSMVVIPTT